MNIKMKILFPVIVFTLIGAAAILISNIMLFSRFVVDSTADRVDSALKIAVNHLEDLKDKAASASLSIAENYMIMEAIENSNRDELLVEAREIQQKADVDFCTITDAAGIVIVRTHEPETYGDSIAEQATIQAAMAGKTMTAIEEGSVVPLSARSAIPVHNEDGVIIGVVSVGYRLDDTEFVDTVKEISGCEATVLMGNVRISTTVLYGDGSRAIGTQPPEEIAAMLRAGIPYTGRVDILGRQAVSSYSIISDPGGKVLGALYAGFYLDETAKTIRAFVQSGIVITLILLAVFITVILVIVGRILAPIHIMTRAASALASGETDIDIGFRADKIRSGETCTLSGTAEEAQERGAAVDEVRVLAGAFNRMIENTKRQLHTIEQIASGDLSVSVEARSEKDAVNRALKELSETMRAQDEAIREEHERIKIMLDATPLACRLWDRNLNIIACNEAAVKLFGLKNKQEYIDRYYELSPEYQSEGLKTKDKIRIVVGEAFEKGTHTNEWMYRLLDGTPMPAENTLVRVPYGDDYVVAAYSRDLRVQKKIMDEIEHRDLLLQIVNEAADILLRSEPGDFADTMQKCMGMMASAIDADRMYLFKNYVKNDKVYFTQLYEWSINVEPFQGTKFTSNILYEDQTEEILETLKAGNCMHSLVRDLPERDRIQLGAQGVLSILTIPVIIRNEFWGFVGFDNCHSEKLFSENEESLMRSGSRLIAYALLRNESILGMKETSVKLETALADAKEANNAKSSFLAHMSHEIRTPLNAVIGFSELVIDEGGLNPEAKSNLEKIYSAGSTILSIVNDILDISKIESGKFEMYPVQYDTPSLINDTVILNIVRIGEKDITFKLYVDQNLPGKLYGDDIRVKQIFNNLLSNAFKYTNSGTVEWSVSFESDGDNVWLISSVRDTGMGIKPDDLKKLFSDYNQVDTRTNRKVEGTGLGLAITKRLVEMMGGTITVNSEYEKGTTFNVRLKQGLVSSTPIGEDVAGNLMGMRYSLSRRAGKSKRGRVNLSYAHILVVDDLVTNLDVVKGMMKPYKIKIDCAISGQEAIDMIRSEAPRYSAVFMDHMMPGMDGIEATKRIREIGTDYARNIPVIALTANAIVGSSEMFLRAGFQDFVSKPIDMMKLDSVLRTWVRNKELEKEFFDANEESAPAEDANSGETGDSMLEGITIPGIDKDKALESFDGDDSIFVEVLRSYASSTRPFLTRLREYLDAENLKDYGIVVHGIKGTSYSIFAQEAGNTARELELAAKEGNLEAVKAGHAGLERITEELLGNIEKALAEIDGK